MSKHTIRRNCTESVFSVNTDSFVDLELKQSTKLLPYSTISDTISQWDIYKQERDNCSKFRLIVTINPYCTNVLFNAITEIVKNEGSNSEVSVVDDTSTLNLEGNAKIIGRIKDITRFHMINNTEYSKEDIGYVYHVGYDFFNNHLLRNLSFKLVNATNSVNDPNFNTIEDTLRYIDGTTKDDFRKRISINDELTDTGKITKHLYDNDDLLNITDSINANLSEDNGWFGFTNASFLPTKKKTDKKKDDRIVWENLGINSALNNQKKCEFIDMYPDRTLFSFNPKYNYFKHKPEYNWKLVITYPFENYYNHEIITNCNGDGKTNALLINNIKKTTGLKSDTVLLIQTYIKHGLKKGDDIYIYYSNDNGYSFKCSEITYKVENVGDFQKNNKDYFFYLDNCNFLDELDNPGELSRYVFRFAHNVNGKKSEYYFRKFRKLPNLKYKRENLTDEIARDNREFQSYIKNNAFDNGKMLDFTREQYKLAFASTIYNDNSTQVVFTDTIDVEHIIDNLGRPLTQLYLTIVKNNSGYKEWYGYNEKEETDYTSDNIEFSHCFGKITSGLMYYIGEEDNNNSNKYKRGQLSDIRLLNNVGCYNTIGIDNDKEITIDDDEFIGDVIEYIPYEVREILLTNIYYRFNTAQREKTGDKKKFGQFRYQEITSDDYDLHGFTVAEYDADDINANISVGGIVLETSVRPEGYYYLPHVEIPIREFAQINQDSHFDIKIKNATPIQRDGIFIKMTSTLPSNVSINDVIYICDDLNEIIYTTKVVSVESQTVFIVNNIKEINWIKFCDIMNNANDNMKFKIRRKNTTIPFYAQKVGSNKYLWREVRNVGDEYNTVVPDYPFTNNHFYITKNVNFFLKRQDPDGTGGLYVKSLFPNDVVGNIRTENIYEYKEETETTC